VLKIISQLFSKNGILSIVVLLCLFLAYRIIDIRTEYRSLQATCSLQKAALNHPKVTVKPKATFKHTEKKTEVKPDQTTTTTEVTDEYSQDQGSVSEPVVPEMPAQAQVKAKVWAAGPCVILSSDRGKQLGISVERDILKYFEINATLSDRCCSLALLYKF